MKTLAIVTVLCCSLPLAGAEAKPSLILALSLQEARSVPAPSVKTCPCSPECVCGCNEGAPCDCNVTSGISYRQRDPEAPYYPGGYVAPYVGTMPYSYYPQRFSPAPASRSGGSRFGGRARSGGG